MINRRAHLHLRVSSSSAPLLEGPPPPGSSTSPAQDSLFLSRAIHLILFYSSASLGSLDDDHYSLSQVDSSVLTTSLMVYPTGTEGMAYGQRVLQHHWWHHGIPGAFQDTRDCAENADVMGNSLCHCAN